MRTSSLLKSLFAVAALVGAVVMSVPSAKASVLNHYTFSFIGKDAYLNYNVIGDLYVSPIADPSSVGGLGYDIVSISGFFSTPAPFSGPITGLSPIFPGRTPDNYLYLAGPYFDANGLAFTVTGGSILNIYGSDPMAMYFGPPYNDVFTNAGTGNIFVEGPGIGGTPLPAALPMFAGGLGVVGLLAARRKRKAAKAAA